MRNDDLRQFLLPASHYILIAHELHTTHAHDHKHIAHELDIAFGTLDRSCVRLMDIRSCGRLMDIRSCGHSFVRASCVHLMDYAQDFAFMDRLAGLTCVLDNGLN